MNNISSILAGLNRNGTISDSQTTAFHPGQILNGKIIKLFPNGIASLQVGAAKVVAQLEASLEANQRYWFQVQPGEGKVRLKVLASAADYGGTSGDSISSLIKELQIPVNAENKNITRFFLKEQLPISKETVEQTAAWLKESESVQAGLEAVKQMIKRQLPMTTTTFQATLAATDSFSLTESLERLSGLMQKESLSHSGQQLASFVKQLLANSTVNEAAISNSGAELAATDKSKITADAPPHAPASFVKIVKELMQRIGYTYEHEVGGFLQDLSNDGFKENALKPLLLNYIREESTGSVREAAEAVLHKITGLQLLAQDFAQIEQFAFQIPLSLWKKPVDLTMQWSGRKLENGQIDPSYCRILFYLELEQLQDTMVDMQVQNRIITLTVVNEYNHLKQLTSPYTDILKENLQALGYKLSFVHFVKPTEYKMKNETKALSSYLSNSPYSGVDIRI
ncbi:hypothetical protein [Niallia endozanthoxylica]|uniref:Flagellar hook-length control protein-like C-terminal domain-containing protein n=1 Tax=Niallia endozanthoxylica TaxID=2036016 RepID=A0A5J5HW18_9BACI|nr:hypothetical protein [Niallia endozanthoxylica]KAA9025893.1 hypothetical protein F4V44_08385 [Niallia endozanthoxylica]